MRFLPCRKLLKTEGCEGVPPWRDDVRFLVGAQGKNYENSKTIGRWSETSKSGTSKLNMFTSGETNM